MDGASLLEVKELLGHKTLAMTLRHAHLAPERLREAVGRLDRVFGPATAEALPALCPSAGTPVSTDLAQVSEAVEPSAGK